MASPQIENGHIDIANTIADKFCSYRISGQEWQIIWVVLRKTWGWLVDKTDKCGPKKKADRIAMSQFEDLTGIDRRKCHEILKKLIKKNIIKKTVTQKGDRIFVTYGFQKNYDLWKLSPKKVTVTQKGDGVSPKKVTKLSPKKVNTKEKKETITKDIPDSVESGEEYFYLTKKKRKLTGKRLESFEKFWSAFNYKKDRASAADSWLDIPLLTDKLVEKICSAASHEANNRQEKILKGITPIYAQGWLTGRRWEDEIENNIISISHKPKTVAEREQEEKELFANR